MVGVILSNIQWAMKVKLEVTANVKRSLMLLHEAIGKTYLMIRLKLPKFQFLESSHVSPVCPSGKSNM